MIWKPYRYEAAQADGNGSVISDEDYRDICRLTVEKMEDGTYTITCGVYSLMVHTVFAANEQEMAYKVGLLHQELAGFADSNTFDDEDATEDWCIAFLQRWQ